MSIADMLKHCNAKNPIARIETLRAPLQDMDLERHLRDDELRIIFMCCYPDLPREARVALSLRLAGGFSVGEIARLFLVEEATVAQRLVRAKRLIRDRGLILAMPVNDGCRERLDSVLDVFYLLFSGGYAAHSGEKLIHRDVCLEAIRLGRLVATSALSTVRLRAARSRRGTCRRLLPRLTPEPPWKKRSTGRRCWSTTIIWRR